VTRIIPWNRVFVEGAVIVFSILLAFAIDAWWAGVGQQKQEKLALDGIETDFAVYLEELAHDRELNQTRVESARALVKLSGRNPGQIDTVRFEDLLSRVLIYSPIIIPAGTLGSLLETDGLAVITDPTLRLELVAWTQALDYSEEMNAYLVEQSRELDAFLKPRYPMAGMLRKITRQTLSTDEQTTGTAFTADAMKLLQDQEFANHVVYAEGASIAMIQGIDRMVKQGEQVLSLVRKRSAELK
jgi:hypothetical protein